MKKRIIRHVSVANKLKLTIVAHQQEGDTWFVGMSLVNNEPARKKTGRQLAELKILSIPQERKNEWPALQEDFSWNAHVTKVSPGVFIMNTCAVSSLINSITVTQEGLISEYCYMFRGQWDGINHMFSTRIKKNIFADMQTNPYFIPSIKYHNKQMDKLCSSLFNKGKKQCR